LTYPITRVIWDFGDGTIVTGGPVIQHSFPNPTLRPVISCYIENSLGCCTTITKATGITVTTDTYFVCDHTNTLVGDNNLEDLLEFLSLSSLNELASEISQVAIDGTLVINEDVTIGSQLNFLLTEGSSIVVNSGIELTKTGGFIGPCDEMFDGVLLQNSASIDLDGVHIFGANTAVSLQENSILNAVNCRIEDSNTGILVTDKGIIESFTSNTIDNCDFGLNANNAGVINITGPNDFLNCQEMGIRYFKTSGDIVSNTFDNCKFGIFLHNTKGISLVEDNIINGVEAAIAMFENPRTDVFSNSIGGTSPVPKYGIYSDFSFPNVRFNPIIKAKYQGVAMYHPLAFNIHGNPNIEVNVNDQLGSNGSGVFIWKAGNRTFGNAGSIWENSITGSNMQGCIYSISSNERSISNNKLTGGRNHGIVIAGGEGNRISANRIFGTPNNGIGLYSAGGGIIHNNEIRSKNLGLLVGNKSNTQRISCNFFLSGGIADIKIHSILGHQFYNGNEFRRNASFAQSIDLSTNEIRNSRFTVNPCNPTSILCEHPDDSTPGLFDILVYDPNDPDNPEGGLWGCGGFGINDIDEPDEESPIVGDPEYWCWLLYHIEESKDVDNRKFWVDS